MSSGSTYGLDGVHNCSYDGRILLNLESRAKLPVQVHSGCRCPCVLYMHVCCVGSCVCVFWGFVQQYHGNAGHSSIVVG